MHEIDPALSAKLVQIFVRQFARSARLPAEEEEAVSENVEVLTSGSELRLVDRATGSTWDSPWDGTSLRAEMFVELCAVFAGQQVLEETNSDAASDVGDTHPTRD